MILQQYSITVISDDLPEAAIQDRSYNGYAERHSLQWRRWKSVPIGIEQKHVESRIKGAHIFLPAEPMHFLVYPPLSRKRPQRFPSRAVASNHKLRVW